MGDEIESIRSFDVLSQRSIENLSDIIIYPASEMILSEEQLKRGMERVEKEGKEFSDRLRGSFIPRKLIAWRPRSGN